MTLPFAVFMAGLSRLSFEIVTIVHTLVMSCIIHVQYIHVCTCNAHTHSHTHTRNSL